MVNWNSRYNEKLTDEARHTLRTAGRPELNNEERAASLFHAMRAAIDAGRLEEAKAHAINLRPLLGFLPEGA